jgi:hypothetical protein
MRLQSGRNLHHIRRRMFMAMIVEVLEMYVDNIID